MLRIVKLDCLWDILLVLFENDLSELAIDKSMVKTSLRKLTSDRTNTLKKIKNKNSLKNS